MEEWKSVLREAQVAAKAAQDITAKAAGRALTAGEKADFDRLFTEATEKKTESDRARETESRDILETLTAEDGDAPAGEEFDVESLRGSKSAGASPDAWSKKAAAALRGVRSAVGQKAVISGSFELPSVTLAPVLKPTDAVRLLELIPARPLAENIFGYVRQVSRTNNATAVADDALKPTSLFSFEEFTDRARVLAHLSEPFPVRYVQDYPSLVGILRNEMAFGVIDALEEQILRGDGLGENLTGILATTGVTAVPFSNDLPTTLRRARTTLEELNENPTSWVFHPRDAERLDLLREGDGTGGFLTLERILGSPRFVVSNRLDEGQALLADWRQAELLVREGSRLDVDAGGDLFDRNEIKLRAEQRVGFAVRRPQAFATVALTPPPV
jgi:HK97 family phage major capsid protein